MYCTHCGKEIPDDSKFCIFCGSTVEVPNATQSNNLARPAEQTPVTHPVSESQTVSTAPKTKKHISPLVIVGIVVVIVLAVILLIPSNDVIADTKALVFDEISSTQLGDAVDETRR